jgi:hypothetical protein
MRFLGLGLLQHLAQNAAGLHEDVAVIALRTLLEERVQLRVDD